MAQRPKDVQIANVYVDPPDTSVEGVGYVRCSETTAVWSRITALVVLANPPVDIKLGVEVDPGARARVRWALVTARELRGSVSSAALRQLPMDTFVREVIQGAEVKGVVDRPDFGPGAFQVPGDPANRAWYSAPPAPAVKGKKVPSDRVERAAQVYLQALAAGSNAPAEEVATVLGYSRATAARDIRAARNRTPPLLPPLGEEASFAAPATGSGRSTLVPLTEWTGRTAAELAQMDQAAQREAERLAALESERARQAAKEAEAQGPADGSK